MNTYKKEQSIRKHTYRHIRRASIIAIIAIVTFSIPALAHAQPTPSDYEETTPNEQTEKASDNETDTNLKQDINPEQDVEYEPESNPQPYPDDTHPDNINVEDENENSSEEADTNDSDESDKPEDESNDTEDTEIDESDDPDSGDIGDSDSDADHEGSEDDESGNVDPSESDVDKRELQALYDEGKQLNPEDYTSDSYKEFKENGLDGAENTLHNDEATQADVDGMIKSFNLYLSQLVEVELDEDPEKNPEEEQEEAPEESKLDTSKLESLLNQAKALNPEDYTESDFAKLTSIVNQAESILENKESTQEYVDTISAGLKNELDNLTTVQQLKAESDANEVSNTDSPSNTEPAENPKPETETVETDQNSTTEADETSETETGGVSNTNHGPGQPLPKTAMSTGTLLLIGSILMATGSLTLLVRRKKVATSII